MNIQRTGSVKTNYHQFILYPLRDMTDPQNGSTVYQSVKNILGPVFDWLDSKVRNVNVNVGPVSMTSPLTTHPQLKDILPDIYDHLDGYAALLPCNNQVICAPFLGLVINLNVATAAHRDSKDDSVCLVLAIGDFEGGDLLLYEPGLVIPL